MTSSYTASTSTSFTITHARHMAAKVAADLKRMQRFYGQPNDTRIADFEEELTLLLRHGYLGRATFGFRRNAAWIEPTLRYTTHDLQGASSADDSPGRVRPGADTSGASFYSYVSYSSAWQELTSAAQAAFEKTLPISRTGAPEPSIDGYLNSDKIYSAGGRSLDRQSLKAF